MIVAVVAALVLVAVTGLLLERVSVPPVPTVRVAADSPPLLLNVTLLRVWLTAAANVRPALPFIVRSLEAAMALLVFRLTVVPVPWTPPLMTRPPAGITMSPGVLGLMVSVPRLTTVPRL